jgi:hypothetical protein
VTVRVLSVVVLLGSAAYLGIYLYRWEWNRALISGVFLLAALITLIGSLVLASLRRLERRIEDLDRDRLERDTRRSVAEASRAEPARRFAWLRGEDRLSVFIPVLLGAGVLLSAAAFVVERVAGLVAGATVDRRTGRLLAPDLPMGPMSSVRADGVPPRPGAGRRLTLAVAMVAAALLGATVLTLRAVTMARSEPVDPGAVTEVALEARHRDRTETPLEVASALWVICRDQIPDEVDLVAARAGVGERVDLVVAPGIGPVGRRRLGGCLEDVRIDRVDADVLSVRSVDR